MSKKLSLEKRKTPYWVRRAVMFTDPGLPVDIFLTYPVFAVALVVTVS